MYDSRARLISTNLLEIPCIAEPREFRFRVSSEREKQKQTEIKQRTFQRRFLSCNMNFKR